MTIYIALLRGINVGGHNMIKMADLKSLLETMGLQKVKTYIQSGNVIFQAEEEKNLSAKIEVGIKDKFGLSVPVVIRTAEELDRLIRNCPFPTEGLVEGESVQVAFLTELPSQEGIKRLSDSYKGADEYQIVGKDVYLFFRHSIRDSKLATQLPKLGVQATVRNWKTVIRLASMGRDLEG